jgi:ribonuclease HI
MTEADVIAYTDGGCRGNPGGIGGWAFLLIHPKTGNALERAGGERETTNNRMEMTAAIEALGAIRRRDLVVVVRSDSRYLINCCSKWLPGWKRRGWRRSEGPLKNVDLLQALDELIARQRVRWEWVRGHAGNRGNERVDELANQAMDRIARGADPRLEKRRTWKLR